MFLYLFMKKRAAKLQVFKTILISLKREDESGVVISELRAGLNPHAEEITFIGPEQIQKKHR